MSSRARLHMKLLVAFLYAASDAALLNRTRASLLSLDASQPAGVVSAAFVVTDAASAQHAMQLCAEGAHRLSCDGFSSVSIHLPRFTNPASCACR